MPSHRSYVIVTLTTFVFHFTAVVECSGDNWYPKICTTGHRDRVTYDANGNIFFGYGDVPEGNFTDYPNENDNQNESSTVTENGEGGRWLRRSDRNLDVASVAEGASPALSWTRETQQHQRGDDGGSSYAQDPSYDTTILPASQRNYSRSQSTEFFRPCLCHPNQLYQNFYGPNETVPDLYICPESAGYCGVPLPGTGPVVCFSVTVQEVVAVNAWPIVLLWYLGMLLICCCTIHGTTAVDYARSFCDPQRNRRNVNRILATRNESVQPPACWNVLAWQKYRFEQNLLAQATMVLRFEDFNTDLLRREQGVPPPSFEMKTRRYSKEEHCTADDHADDDSIHEPACTICFVPLEDGDIVGDLPCRHIFHKTCLKTWCTRKNACPLCNATLATRRRDSQPQDIAASPHQSC